MTFLKKNNMYKYIKIQHKLLVITIKEVTIKCQKN